MVRASCLFICCLLGALLLVVPATAYPSGGNYLRLGGQYEPEQIADMLTRLNELMDMERKMETFKEDMISGEKRALDMGLNRGYSGALQAKHLMGVAAANYAAGPGRRRRDTE